MLDFIRKLAGDGHAVSALEYALIASLVAVVIIAGVRLLGSNVSKVFSTVANTI
jgi:pilus assembly protein Flp/PilA